MSFVRPVLAVLLLAVCAQAAAFADRNALKAAVDEWIADPTQAAQTHGDTGAVTPYELYRC